MLFKIWIIFKTAINNLILTEIIITYSYVYVGRGIYPFICT